MLACLQTLKTMGVSGCHVLQLEELQKVKIPTSIKVTPTRGGLLDIYD